MFLLHGASMLDLHSKTRVVKSELEHIALYVLVGLTVLSGGV